MKKKQTKLAIHRQTLRVLENSDLAQAAGGDPTTYSITETAQLQKNLSER